MKDSEIDNALKSLIIRAASEATGEDEDRIAPDMQARRLIDNFELMDQYHEFGVGELVEQVKGLDKYTYPKRGNPAIITNLISPAKEDGVAGGGAYERVDMIILVLTGGGNAVEFGVDSRRFEPYKGKIA